jgi:MraZ protein
MQSALILGEFECTLDERFRLTIPQSLAELLTQSSNTSSSTRCMLAKERQGCLSLWSAESWEQKLNARVKLVEQKLQADSFGDDRIAQVQLLGRLLSTRHQAVELRGRSRLLIPEGFRKFLGVERDPPENQVLVVGAAVCIEIWKPAAWLAYLEQRMPRFRKLFHRLSR